MPTVVARFEPSRKVPGKGTIYYRIYKGHCRRMKFSSRIHVRASVWNELNQIVNVDSIEAYQIKAKINEDLMLLNSIINEGKYETIGDIIRIFKYQRQNAK